LGLPAIYQRKAPKRPGAEPQTIVWYPALRRQIMRSAGNSLKLLRFPNSGMSKIHAAAGHLATIRGVGNRQSSGSGAAKHERSQKSGGLAFLKKASALF